jgi:hypothetical protein
MKAFVLAVLVATIGISANASTQSFKRKSMNELSGVVAEINAKLPDNYCAPSRMVALRSDEVTSRKLSALLNDADVENVQSVKRGFDLELATMATLVDVVSDEEKAQAVGTRLMSALVNRMGELQFEKDVKIYRFFLPDYYAHTEIGGLVVLDAVANQALIVSFPICP